MALFYKGAARGSHWHTHDAHVLGLTAWRPGRPASPDVLLQHIARARTDGPYISLTRSFGIAYDYAIVSNPPPSRQDPAYVYEIDLDDPLPSAVQLRDPIADILARSSNNLLNAAHHHEGRQEFLLGLVSNSMFGALTRRPVLQPNPSGNPPCIAGPHPPNQSIELVALVRALRDAEVLVLGTIPTSCINPRIPVY